MGEETILKSSFFGGYKKCDVIQYIDSVLEENEKKVVELEEKVALLMKQNKALNLQISTGVKASPVVPGVNYGAEHDQVHNNKQIPFTTPLPNGFGNQEPLSVRQQMKIPEGLYRISEDNKVISMPEPMPSYQTKGENSIPNSTETKVDPLPQGSGQWAQPLYCNNMAAEMAAAEQAEESGTADIYTRTKSEHSQMSNSLKQKLDVILEQMFNEELAEIQAELKFVKEALEKEKQEKQALASKLEFSNELLLQLYKKQ